MFCRLFFPGSARENGGGRERGGTGGNLSAGLKQKRSIMRNNILLFVLLLLAAPVCAADGGRVHIAYSCSNFDDAFQMRILEEARAETERANGKFTAMDAREEAALQLRQIDQLLANGADALLVVPVDTSNVDGIIAAAGKAHVPLVFVNRNPFVGERPPDNCFVIATDARVEGETQMNHAGPRIGAMGRVVILQGLLNNEATQSRTAGVRDVIRQSYPELAITAEATAHWQRDTAKTVMEEWIGAYGREGIDAVLANNDEMALGALDALDAAGMTDVLVMGVDAIPEALAAIKSGRMAGSVLQDSSLQGSGGVQIALRALRGESQAQNFILPSELVTRDNVDQFIDAGK